MYSKCDKPMPTCLGGNFPLPHWSPQTGPEEAPARNMVVPPVTSGGFFYFYERMGPRSMNRRSAERSRRPKQKAPLGTGAEFAIWKFPIRKPHNGRACTTLKRAKNLLGCPGDAKLVRP